jgi:Flp pilus assembly pilin Flp
MQTMMIQTYLTLRTMAGRLADRAKSDERGQTTAEYLGILAFVAVVIVALTSTQTGIPKALTDGVKAAVAKVAGLVPG